MSRSITNYGTLVAAVTDFVKRFDLGVATRIPDFIEETHIELQEYVGGLDPLVNDTDTNALLDYNPYIYRNGAIGRDALFLQDTGPLAAYLGLYQTQLANLAMTGFEFIALSPNYGVAP